MVEVASVRPRYTQGPDTGRPASPCPPRPTGRRSPPEGLDVLAAALRQIPAFSAIGRDLVEHRVGEIALRARADGTSDREDVATEWGLTGVELRGPLVAELMQAMERAPGLDVP
jgi:hypothetical protein